MKNIITLSTLLLLSLGSFARPYFIFTANKSGNWDNAGTWSAVIRNDNVQKDKFIIPAALIVTADEDVNDMGLDDVELQISGVLRLGSSATLYFGDNSRIEILATGSIQGNGASQQIFIGDDSKYAGNKNKTLLGPVYADATTTGFAAYSMLSVNFLSFTGTLNSDNSVSLKWSVSNEENNKQYEIEAKSVNSDWKTIGVVIARNNNNVTNSYQFINKYAAAGNTSYRVKQVDTDGKLQYSNTITVNNIQSMNTAKIFASNKTVNVEFASEVRSSVIVKIMNMNGLVVSSQSHAHPSKISVNMSHVNGGIYVVSVSDNMNNSTVQKIMLN